MDILLKTLLVVFGFSGVIIALMLTLWKQWVAWLGLLLLMPWLYYGQWWARAMWDMQWVDDAPSRVMQERLMSAFKRGSTTVMVRDLTPFSWKAMCMLWPGTNYQDDKNLIELFGTELNNLPAYGSGFGDIAFPVFATRDGAYSLNPFFGRWSSWFQSQRMGRAYAAELNGVGYVIEMKTVEKSKVFSSPVCYSPDEVWIEVSPEPAEYRAFYNHFN